MRYKFHEQLDKIRHNPKYVLPGDINAPVHEYLEKIGCKECDELLYEFERDAAYGTIDIIHDDVPAAKITIQVDAGMVGEFKKWDVKKSGKWLLIHYRNVKNANIDKSNPK